MSWLRRNALFVYLFLAFALSWWPWPLKQLNPESVAMVPFGPIIAAFIAVAIANGRTGVVNLLKDMIRWKVGVRWYLVAFALPLGITLAAIYLNALLGAPAPTGARLSEWYLLIPAFVTTTLLAGALTEEPGWRGFALPRYQLKYSALTSSLIVGLIWFSWHLPLLLTNDKGGQRPPLQYFFLLLGMSIVFTWLYNGTKGSVFLAILMHGAFNTFAAFFFPIQSGEFYDRLWWFIVVLWWVAAFAIIFSTAVNRDRRPAAARIQEIP